MQLCPYCEKGELHIFTDSETIVHGGKQLLVPGVQLSRCDACGEEMATPEQAKANQVLFADAKRGVDGLMTSRQIRAWRKALSWSQVDAVNLFGGGANAFSKYERGEVVQSRQMDLLMRLVALSPEARSILPRIVSGDLQHVLEVVAAPLSGAVEVVEEEWSPVKTTPAVHSVFNRLLDSWARCANDDNYSYSGSREALAL